MKALMLGMSLRLSPWAEEAVNREYVWGWLPSLNCLRNSVCAFGHRGWPIVALFAGQSYSFTQDHTRKMGHSFVSTLIFQI